MLEISTEFNRPLLDAVAAAKLWFPARKTRPIWAKLLEAPRTLRTLEGDEQVPAGAYLCRGEAGDVWPQGAERLLAKYLATDEFAADGWRKYVPRPDSEGVLAACIDKPFAVESRWGRLHGKPGDYLVKNFGDRDVENPADVWIVAGHLFQATYARVSDASGSQATEQ